MPPPKSILPNQPWLDYGPFPTIVGNTLGVEFSSSYPGTFAPIEPGTPFTPKNHSVADATAYAGMIFLRQTVGDNREFQRQVWATPPTLQDLYNYEIDFSDDAATYPIFTRHYLILRDQYSRTAEGAVFTGIYAIQVSAGGTGYPNGGAVTFTGGGGTGATAIAITDSNGVIVKITLKNEGAGYTSTPTVVLPSGGSGGSATAIVHPAGCLLISEKVKRTPDKDWDSLYFLVERTYETLPGPQRVGWIQNPLSQVASSITEQRITTASVAEPTPLLGQNVQIKHINAEVAEITKKQADTVATANFYMTFPGEGNWELPLNLLAVFVNWDIAVATGQYREVGSGAAVGSSASLSLRASGSAQSSASALGDIVPIWAPRPAQSLPWLDIFSFLPTPVSLTQMLTEASVKYSAFIGSSVAVNAWPIFSTQPHTIWISGQKASVSADSATSCAVSLNADDTSFAESNGEGTKQDIGSNVKSVTIPDSIHAGITFIGSPYVIALASASASAILSPGNNWPGGFAASQASQYAISSVFPTSLASTGVTTYPATGIYLKSPQASPGEDGYTTCRARLCNFAILSNGVTLGQPQITVADFNGLTGSHFRTGQAQITTVDWTGLSGSNFATGKSQNTTFNFTGLTGASFVTGAAGLAFLLPDSAGNVYGIWFKISTETQPSLVTATAYVMVDASATGSGSTAAQMAGYLVTALGALSSIWTVAIGGANVGISSTFLGPQPVASDVNSAVAITVGQIGVTPSAGKAFLLPSSAGVTYGVWVSTGPELQPNLSQYTVGNFIKVLITPSSNAGALATAFSTALAPYTNLWTNAVSGDVVTLTSVSLAAQGSASDINTGAVITVTQFSGNVGKYFNIYGYQGFAATPVWFNTGTETAPAVPGASLQINITTGNTASQIAAAVVAQVPALIGPTWAMAQITGGGANTAAQFTASANRTTTNAVDVTSGAAITTPQEGQPANV